MSQHLIDSGRQATSVGTAAGQAGAERPGGEGTRSPAGGPGRGGAEPGDGDATREAGGATGGATVGALDALAQALQQLAGDQQLLEERVGELRRRRAEGGAWRDILAEEEPPGTMQVVSRMLATLAGASGTLRKELVDDLRREGASIPAIAKLFGVTHQRVSNLLRRRVA